MNKAFYLFATMQFGLFCTSLTASEAPNYSLVAEAESARMNEVIVRYIRELGSPCITAQTLDPKNDWKIISSRYFCSFNGRSFLDDFTDAHFEGFNFSESGIDMILSITPLEPTGEHRLNCTIPILQNTIQEMTCKKQE